MHHFMWMILVVLSGAATNLMLFPSNPREAKTFIQFNLGFIFISLKFWLHASPLGNNQVAKNSHSHKQPEHIGNKCKNFFHLSMRCFFPQKQALMLHFCNSGFSIMEAFSTLPILPHLSIMTSSKIKAND